MTEKRNRKEEAFNKPLPQRKLSIQIGLNGLSFFVWDTITNDIILSESKSFKTQSTPYLIQKELKQLLEAHELLQHEFTQVVVVHKNDMFCLVPKTLFDAKESANYLKFNTKLLANDHIVYDELTNYDLVCTYVPFSNINNMVFDIYGEFEFKHSSITFLQTLSRQKIGQKKVCYVHTTRNTMELAVFHQKKLLLYNQYTFKTAEDFVYYILFCYEQLNLDAENVKLKLFGSVEEGDPNFDICYKYIKKVSVFEPKNDILGTAPGQDRKSIDLTLLNSL